MSIEKNIKILKDMLKVKPLPSKDLETRKFVKWTEADKLMVSSGLPIANTTNVSKLKQFLIAVIKALPKNPEQKNVRQTVHLAGRVWTHLVINDNTYSNAKEPIRSAIKEHFFKNDYSLGEDFLNADDVKFDDRQRTIDTNADNAAKADLREDNQVEISAERVEKIVKQMVEDLDSGEAKYATVAILLGDLCLGARWVESLMFAKFVPDEEKTVTGAKKIKTRWVTQTGIAKKFNRGVDNRNFSIHKPGLPYVDSKYVVEKINAFREARPELLEREGSYDSSNSGHKLLANRYRRRANLLIQKRYFQDLLSRSEAIEAKSEQRAASSHLLRAIWVNLTYFLFRKKGQAKDKYVKDMLGHDSYNPGIRYKDVEIIEAKDDPYLEKLKFGNVSKKAVDEAADNAEADDVEDDNDDVEDDGGAPLPQDQEEDRDQAEEAARNGKEEAEEPEPPAKVPARRPPIKPRPDNLEEPRDNEPPAQGYYSAKYNADANENKELKARVAK
jgi:hypothetical protein